MADCGGTERSPIHRIRPFEGTGFVLHEAHSKAGNVRNQGVEMLNSA